MGDFGAASQQRIEVRAFGCLLDDLIELTIARNNHEQQLLQAFITLKNACTQPVVQLRPSFQEILVELGKI